tara:strand:- start:24793 stop:25542 length:750 start_codon:yes stop_codon:yes gene_type:complete
MINYVNLTLLRFSKLEIENYLDSTYLKTSGEAEVSNDETRVRVERLIDEAISHNFACVMIRPEFVTLAVQKIKLTESRIKVGTVIDFPLGQGSTNLKIQEAIAAINDGAFDIDFVSDYNAFKRGDLCKFDADILQATNVVLNENKVAKWIIETGSLSREEIRNISKRIADIVQSNFPHKCNDVFIKTSTGYYGDLGATIKDVKIIRSVSGKLQVKASGGISSLKDCIKMIQAGAARIGTSKAALIYSQK